MDASHVSPSILMGMVAVTIIIGITLAFLPTNLVKIERRKKLAVHKFLK